MLHTLEAVLEPDGALRFLEPVRIQRAQRVLVTFTQPQEEVADTATASEASLAVDWLLDDEERAWAHLQPHSGEQAAQEQPK